MHIAMNRLLGSSTFTVFLGKSAHQRSQALCHGYNNSTKVRQVYLNGLAVYAVAYYLQCMGFETDSETSQLRHPAVRAVMDVADLKVIGQGTLECRPVLPGESTLAVPPEVFHDRIGYVAVQLTDDLSQAILVGFAETVANHGQLALVSLQSIEELPDYLDALATPVPLHNRESLSSWWENLFGQGWQTLEALLGIPQTTLSFSLRNQAHVKTAGIQRAKLLDLGMQLGHQSVVLLVAIAPSPEAEQSHSNTCEEFTLLMQLHPADGEPCLPADITLTLLSANQEVLQTVRSRVQDNYIQLKRFQAMVNEVFDVVIAHGETCITESFRV